MPDVQAAVALIGNPNTGKSSLFNALCGGNARVGNYPGVTVEQKVGKLALRADMSSDTSFNSIDVIDLPGTYSLSARSADEAVSVDVLAGRIEGIGELKAVIVVVDATHLDRNLYLFSQVLELKLPTILVLNMWDRVESTGLQIDTETLAARLNVPIVCTCATSGAGLERLKSVIGDAVSDAAPGHSISQTNVNLASATFPKAFHDEVLLIEKKLMEVGIQLREYQIQRILIDSTDGHTHQALPQEHRESIERWVVEARKRLAEVGCSVPLFETKARYAWVKRITSGLVKSSTKNPVSNDTLDRWLAHPWIGMAFFLLVMFFLFQSITWVARWPMDWIIDKQAWIGASIESWMSPGPLRSLLVNGVVAGVGALLVFIPQIAILFLFIGLLEDSGYLSRAAFIMDRAMSKIGLSGRSFLPLMSSFACAIPGIMATRTIDNHRDRMVTMLIAPLMSCSARLPVYVLMVSAFIPDLKFVGGWITLQGIVLFGMQCVGVIIAIPVALILKKFFFPGEASTFVLEVPNYKWPSLRPVVSRVWERVTSFIAGAGTLIVCTSILVWAAGYFPGDHSKLSVATSELEALHRAGTESSEDALRINELRQLVNHEKSRLIDSSFLGMAGRTIQPIVRPLGWDGKIGIAVLASFPAREVIIATLGTIYSLGSDADSESESLKDQLRDARWPDGSPVYTLATAFSIMVFFALCAQCASTLVTIRRETNSWRWPIFSFVYMTTLAYVGALITYQIVIRL